MVDPSTARRTSQRVINQRRSIMKKHAMLKRVAAGAVLSATLAVPGIVGLTAATANAMPISQLARECRSAPQGLWVRHGSTGYSCYYNDASGNRHVDWYDRRGRYYGSG
jgi:hypothetical protein